MKPQGKILLPSEGETAAITLKPKTAALCYDRVWAPTNDLVPESIRCYGGTAFEDIKTGGSIPAVYNILKHAETEMMKKVPHVSFREIADELLMNLRKSDEDQWGLLPCYLRVIAEKFSRQCGLPMIPAYETLQDRKRVYEEGDRLVIYLTLTDLAIVDEKQLTWKQVIDFRKDKDNQKKYKHLLHWLDKGMIGRSQSFIEDEIAIKLDDHERALKKHGIKTILGAVEEGLDGKYLLGASGISSFMTLAGHPVLGVLLGAGLVVGKIGIKLTQIKLDFDDIERGANSEISWVYEVKELSGK